jgi:hypothetical protein
MFLTAPAARGIRHFRKAACYKSEEWLNLLKEQYFTSNSWMLMLIPVFSGSVLKSSQGNFGEPAGF